MTTIPEFHKMHTEFLKKERGLREIKTEMLKLIDDYGWKRYVEGRADGDGSYHAAWRSWKESIKKLDKIKAVLEDIE